MVKDDVDRLLDADVWPNNVTINVTRSKWSLKPKSHDHMDQYVEPGDGPLHGDVHLSVVGGSLPGQMASDTATGEQVYGTNYVI